MSNKSHEKMDGTFDNPQAEKSAADTGKPARPPKPKTSLGRETKVGLGVIGALLVIFVVVLVVRLRDDGDDDVAQNGTSVAEDGVGEKSGAAEKKVSPSKEPTVISARTGSERLPSYNLGANPDTADANAGYGFPRPNQNQASVQDGSQFGYPQPNGADAPANGNAAGGSQAADGADGAVINPFGPRPGTSAANSSARGAKASLHPQGNDSSLETQYDKDDPNSAVDQAAADEATTDDRAASAPNSGTFGDFQTKQASGTPLSGSVDLQDYSPTRETATAENRATASDGRGTVPSANADLGGGSQSSVRIVAGEGPNATVDRDFASSSGNLTPVDDFASAKPRSNQPSTSITASRGDAGDAKRWQVPEQRATVAEPARIDDVIAEGGDPPAPLNVDSTPGDRPYIVRANDNYWTIAKDAYGSGAYFKALYEYNRRNAGQVDVIRAGAQLRLPDEATLQQLYPTLCPPPSRLAATSQTRTASVNVDVDEGRYEVQDGDTLYEIARRQLGKGSRFAEVYELNRDVIGRPTDRLQPGTRLRLPGER